MQDVRAPSIFKCAEEELELKKRESIEKHDMNHVVHHHPSHNEDLDVEDVRAPNMFERAKEEIEAVVQSFHEKHDKTNKKLVQNGNESASTGCWMYMGKTFERICGGGRT